MVSTAARNPTKRNQSPMCNPPKWYQPPHAIHPNETVGAAPVCPPERPRSGVSIPKIHALCAGNERWMRPCRATRAGIQTPPLPISTKPHGVPIPHRGYTFDSAGLASATQPTLGNNASKEATPLGGCTLSHRTSLPHAANDFSTRKLKKVQCRWHRFPSTTLPRVASYRRQPWADKSTTPMVLVHVHRFHQPTNKTTHTHRGRKCIAHSRPHSLKQIVCMQIGISVDAPFVLKQVISLV